MKIAIIDDSCVQTRVSLAEQDDEHTIEITDAEWAEFNDVEERYESLLYGFKQRLLAKRLETMDEIAQLRARLSQLEARLGVAPAPTPVAAAPIQPKAPIDETDAGMGGRAEPWMGSMSTADLRDAHAELRQRTAEKRLKLR